MGWPKGKPRPDATATRARHNFKACASCGEEKSLDKFGYAHWRSGWKQKRAADPEKYRDSCKDCTKAKNGVEADPEFKADRRGRPTKKARAPSRNTPEGRKYQRMQKRSLRARARAACLRYLASKGCEDCGERDPRVLEFDHLDPKRKKAAIALLLSQGYSWGNEKVRKEVRKCRVLCANCHRKHTIEQQGYYGHEIVRAELDTIRERYNLP